MCGKCKANKRPIFLRFLGKYGDHDYKITQIEEIGHRSKFTSIIAVHLTLQCRFCGDIEYMPDFSFENLAQIFKKSPQMFAKSLGDLNYRLGDYNEEKNG